MTPIAGKRPRTISHTRIVTGRVSLTVATWVLVLMFVFPFLWMILTSFKPESQASTPVPLLWADWTLDGFRVAFDRGMAGHLINSATASVLSTIFVLALAIPAAYALSVRPIKKSKDALLFFLSTRFMPVAAAIIPIYLLLQYFNLLDDINALGVLYIGINLPIAVWMMRSFFVEIPFEVIEAARVDGASVKTELLRIALPMVLPGIAATGLICLIFAWNEYFLATIITSNVARTTPPFLTSFVDGRGLFLASLSAASSIAALPVLLAGWFAQRQLVRGLAMGAIK